MKSLFKISILVTVLIVLGSVYVAKTAVCQIPISYRLGSIDERFSIINEEAKQAISRAEEVWEKPLEKELFVYDENSNFTINFVFDERLGERITDDIIANCHQCGKPCDVHTNCLNDGCHLLFIQCPECARKFEGCCSAECKETLHLPEERRKELRKVIDKGRNVFNKSSSRMNKLS